MKNIYFSKITPDGRQEEVLKGPESVAVSSDFTLLLGESIKANKLQINLPPRCISVAGCACVWEILWEIQLKAI